MEIANNLHWRLYFLYNDRLRSQNLRAFISQLNNVLSLEWKLLSRLDVLTVFWLQESFQKHLAKSFVRIFLNFDIMLLIWIESLWLLSQLVNRNLSDYQRKVFRFMDLLLIGLCGNISLVCKLEISFHVIESLVIFLNAIRFLIIIATIFFWFYL